MPYAVDITTNTKSKLFSTNRFQTSQLQTSAQSRNGSTQLRFSCLTLHHNALPGLMLQLCDRAHVATIPNKNSFVSLVTNSTDNSRH